MLTQNPPIDRLKYIQKLYGEKQPWVVLDTLSVIFPTIGIDEPWREIEEASYAQASEAASASRGAMREMFQAGRVMPGLPDPRWTNGGDYIPLVNNAWNLGPIKYRAPYDLRYDERSNMIFSFVAQDSFAGGAMREPQEADSVFPWVARELSKLSKHTISAIEKSIKEDTSLLDDYEDYYADYSEALEQLRRSTNLIAQWSKATRTDLMKLSLAEVFEKSEGFRIKRKVEHGEFVYKFKNGWTVESLKGKRQLDCEAGFLSHCVYTYKDRVDSGQSVIYSLRDPDGVPYVTMEWQPWPREMVEFDEGPKDKKGWPGRFTQVFGKTNSKIGHDVFNEYVLAAGQDNDPPLQPDQVSVVVEAIRSMVVEFIDQKRGGEVRGLLLAGASLAGRDLSKYAIVGTNLGGADLSRANLSEAYLYGVNLYEANLTGANLTGASLERANLSRANLSGADLSGANLSEAHLREANLREANLTAAYLVTARLTGANLNGANLNGANLAAADLWRADLSGADMRGARLKGYAPLLDRTRFDDSTKWSEGFDPIAAGAVKVD